MPVKQAIEGKDPFNPLLITFKLMTSSTLTKEYVELFNDDNYVHEPFTAEEYAYAYGCGSWEESCRVYGSPAPTPNHDKLNSDSTSYELADIYFGSRKKKLKAILWCAFNDALDDDYNNDYASSGYYNIGHTLGRRVASGVYTEEQVSQLKAVVKRVTGKYKDVIGSRHLEYIWNIQNELGITQ